MTSPVPADAYGELVRETWVAWASEQPGPKPSWLVPWSELDEGQREVDRRIGVAVAAAERGRALAVFNGSVAYLAGLVCGMGKIDGGEDWHRYLECFRQVRDELAFGLNALPGETLEAPSPDRAAAIAAVARAEGGAAERERIRKLADENGATYPVQPESGAALIAAERQRQVSEEGWTAEHDAQHPAGDLAYAAAAYVINAAARIGRNGGDLFTRAGVTSWPWEESGFKPGTAPTGSLVKAGALIAAEIDRLLAGGEVPDGGQDGGPDGG